MVNLYFYYRHSCRISKSSTTGDCVYNTLGISERKQIGSLNKTDNVLMVDLKLQLNIIIYVSQCLMFWWSYTENRDTLAKRITVQPLQTYNEINLDISDIIKLIYLNNNDNLLLMELNMTTLWNVFDSQYMFCWFTYNLNKYTLIRIIVF